MKMKVYLLVVFLGIFELTSYAQDVVPDKRGYIVKVGDKVEDFSLTFLDGSTKTLSQLNAPVIVLNFFASWCIVCRKEIPHIEKEIWEPLQDKGLIVIGVNYKEKPAVVRKAVEEMGMTYPIALDEDGSVFEKFARGGVTRNIVLDKDLNIIFLTRLFDPQEFEAMKNVILKQLGLKTQALQSGENKGANVEKIFLQDLAGTNKKIALAYDGKHKIYLEGKIFSADKNTLEIGVSLFEDDIVSSKYDKKSKTFKIGYRHYDGVRIAVLPMTKFKVPADVEHVIIYDVE